MLVHSLAVVVQLVLVLVELRVMRILWVLVRLLLLLLLLLCKFPDLQSPQVDKENKTGRHRHKQVPLLGLHVCCRG